MPPLRDVAVVVDHGVSAFEFATACEVFGIDRTDDGVPPFDFAVCSPRPGPLRSAQGFTLTADHGLDRLDSADLVVVAPALRGDGPSAVDPTPELTEHLRAALDRGATVAAFCGATFTLARAGLLDGLRATTHHRYADRLAAEHPAVRVVPDVLYVVEPGPAGRGTLATSAGTSAGIDLSLHLLREHHGTAVARAVARRMVVPPHRDGGQAQYVDVPVRACADASLQPVLAWAQTHLDDPIDVTAWARRAAMSPRTFARRFRAETGVTPHRWLLDQRVTAARELLEDGDESVEEVARRCGFGSATALRQHFQRVVGTTPTAYRRAYRGPRPADPRRAAPLAAVAT